MTKIIIKEMDRKTDNFKKMFTLIDKDVIEFQSHCI